MKRPDSCIVWASILMIILCASTVLAAYEFYIIKLTSKTPIHWATVERVISSVKGVERTQIDQEKGLVTVTCSNQCDASILNDVNNKLKTKGIEVQIVNQPASVDGKDPRGKRTAPAKKAY